MLPSDKTDQSSSKSSDTEDLSYNANNGRLIGEQYAAMYNVMRQHRLDHQTSMTLMSYHIYAMNMAVAQRKPDEDERK